MGKGCGWLLIIVSVVMILVAVLIAGVAIWADIDAGEKHEAKWKEYNQQVVAYDSIPDKAVRDSLIAELPRPYIRQGGFAALFVMVLGGGVILIALVPLVVGCVLIMIHRRKKRKEKELLI